jgi:hypothetical protein
MISSAADDKEDDDGRDDTSTQDSKQAMLAAEFTILCLACANGVSEALIARQDGNMKGLFSSTYHPVVICQ